jgi:hypothetical protein
MSLDSVTDVVQVLSPVVDAGFDEISPACYSVVTT